MKSWIRRYAWEIDVVGYALDFGSIGEPRAEGKGILPQLMGETSHYYFPDPTVMESIWGRMRIWADTTRTLRRGLR